MLALLTMSSNAMAAIVTVDAKNNDIGAFSHGANTGLTLSAGQTFTVTVSQLDLWSAGADLRQSTAAGLVGPLNATAGDDSGKVPGTPIGQDFGGHTEMGFTAPFGALVGNIGGTGFFLIGTNYTGTAPTGGLLRLFYWDGFANGWYGDNSGSIAANVNAVPLPAAAWLLLSGLVGFGAIARRKRVTTA